MNIGIALMILALAGWAIWGYLLLAKQWSLYGFGNWFVALLYRCARWMGAIASATDQWVAEYRRAQSKPLAETYTDLGDALRYRL